MPRKKIEVEMEEVRVRIPKVQVRRIQELVKKGEYVDMSEALRAAVREFLQKLKEE